MSSARHHAEWLHLVEVSGPFLSLPVLERIFPQGLPDPSDETETVRTLRMAYAEWQAEQERLPPDPAIHRAWISLVLRTVLGFEATPDLLLEGQAIPSGLVTTVAEHHETLRPDLVLVDPASRGGKPRLLIAVVPPHQGLEAALPEARWKAGPAERMALLLHAAEVRLGLVTNGEAWMLVDAPRGETSGYCTWYAQIWLDERPTLRAFHALLGVARFFQVPDHETLEALLLDSAGAQQEVTDRLGYQVRQAVAVLVRAVDQADKDRRRALLAEVDEPTLYQAALAVMMRLVLLLTAEERDLLPLDNLLYNGAYAVSTLRARLREAADRDSEEVLERHYDAWSRLLATFRAVHGGVAHPDLRLIPYGGSLFDPDRYPFLEGRRAGTTWRHTEAEPLPINNRTVLHLLEALQQLKVRSASGTETRLLSFRALDVEQIGHVYEGLLDHTARRAPEPMLGLAGGKEPELSLARLEDLAARGVDDLVAYLKEQTGRGENALRKALATSAPALLSDHRLLTACDNDHALYQRVLPFADLLRQDSHGYPLVITAGSVYVTSGLDRRSSGTHYTPRSLTEPIVRYTLEPLVYHGPAEGMPREEWRLRAAGELLELKICDMAMGSGAFLVQACRYLAERLVEAWAGAEAAHPGRVVITPEGALSSGEAGERPLPREEKERLILAQRLIADRCLYGVDKNPMAVEIAKFSLWLLTLQKDRPFTFLDHALRCNDSLLGLDIEQLQAWSLEYKHLHQYSIFEEAIRRAVERSIYLRRKILAREERDIHDIQEKTRLLDESLKATELVRLGADLLLSTVLASKRQQEATRIDLLARYSIVVAAVEEQLSHPYTELGRKQAAEALAHLQEEAVNRLNGHRPFHWMLEFPEVFFDLDMVAAPKGFSAFVGNPPFVGGQRITGVLSENYRDYLVDYLAGGKRGSADLCAYFFLRASKQVRKYGGFGLIATNTIAQGDTREVGLDQIVANGYVFPRAVASRPWPGAANLEVAHVWARRGPWAKPFILNDQEVSGITAFLTVPGAVEGKPYRLKANEGKSFQGSIVLGMGFVLEPEEAAALLARDPRNRAVLFPYLNGEDLNSRPDQSPSRWVINFHDWPLEQAETYPDCLAIVREKVKPERDKNTFSRNAKEKWWQYERGRPELYATTAGMERVLVRARVANINSIAFVPPGIVASEATVVFASDKWWFFVLLQAFAHTEWLTYYASSMRTDVRYTPSDCFETFPFPDTTAGLDEIGERYYAHRQAIMTARQEGLTKTYNRFHNPDEQAEDIAALRALHVAMDQAVAAAYGWGDLDLGHGFHQTRQGMRYTISEAARREVLGKLLALNHARYAEEVAQGLHDKGAKGKGAKGKRGRHARAGQGALFGEGAD